MVILPSVVLLVMWAVFSSYTIFEGFYLRTVGLGVKEASIPAVNSLVALQKERQLTMLSLGHSPAATATLPAQRAETDRAVDQMKSKMQGLLSGAPENIVQGADKLVSLLDQLPQERGRIDGHTASPEEIFDYYNSVLDAGGNLFETQSRLVPDGESIQGALTATDLFRAADQMSRVASLGGNAVAAGRFTPEQHTTFVSLVGSYRSKLITNAPNLQPQAKAEYEQLLNSDAWRNLQQLENRLISSPRQDGELGVSEQQWLDASNQVADELVKIVTSHSTQAVELVLANGNARYFEVIIGSAVALLAVVLGIVLAIRNSRRLVDRALVTRLANLRTDSLTLAQERLPDIMTRLERGEKVDIESELPALDYGGDEIGQVADAFNTAQFTAVSAAVKESQAREGVNKVFLGIAHRNQGLVHRQLKVLDKMEREEENPERLDTLFQLDHLATRARRNAENLIILADRWGTART